MDYNKLRAAALSHGEDEEAVTVDTRALIDKVLARYSGEWTTLRELIQNAADAQATTVKIKWETLPSTSVPLPPNADRSDLLKHTIQHHTLRRLVVSNNGQPFAKTDWARLKRIAEGNPDETKIGAFGVGFYSVFADCEEPFISSGGEAMAFYWKGNALFTRKLQLGEEQRSNETAFVLDYRNTTTTVPNALSVSQFLATSLTFVALQHIEFWIDDYQILSLHKKTSPSVDVALSRDVETTTKERLMKIQKVDQASAQIDASYMAAIGWKPRVTASRANESYGSSNTEIPSLRSFFSRLTTNTSSAKAKKAAEEKAVQEAISEDITALSNSSIFLRVTTATIKTSVTASFAAELERATKKPPPKLTKLAILTSSYDEVKASETSSSSGNMSKAADVFASVLPTKKPGGRIFIGFPTTQTTGAGMHISAPSVIPTVEREAIDLNARWVRNWNIEMLRAAGIMTRLAYTNEMSELQQKLQRSVEGANAKITPEAIAKHLPEALHVLNSFAFGDSTPSGQVSQIIEEAFWTSYKRPLIEIYSTRGVRMTTQVRIDSEELSKFVPGIPVIPVGLKETEFVKKLIYYDLLSHITVDDVSKELSEYPMSKDQLIAFIQWASKKAVMGELSPTENARLLDSAIATLGDAGTDQGGIITLGSIKSYVSPNKIPAGLPIPPTTIPFEFTKHANAHELKALGWEPLEIVPWLRFLLETRSSRPEAQDITKTSSFATQVLTVISKNWENLSQSSKDTVTQLLKTNTVMPTKLGMRKPTDSFFPSVKLFDDLPIISPQCMSMKDKFLSALGVRKTVALDIIFQRLLNTSSEKSAGQAKWSHVELIKYLASVRADIPSDDLRKLKESRICPAEAGPAGQESSQGSAQLYKVSELFEPKGDLRPLGVKVLQWPEYYRRASAEGKFLAALGLRAYPSAPELVELMSSPEPELRAYSMKYFILNHASNNYSSFDIGQCEKSFLPLEGNPKQLVTPKNCFTNTNASILGLNILKRDLHEHALKFGVKRDPHIADCISWLLRNIPQTPQSATPVFEYFATRITEIGGSQDSQLSNAPIVPVVRQRLASSLSEKTGGTVTHVSPRNCYLGSSTTYGDIFDFVDFGQQANSFLFRLGAKLEPTKVEVARMAASEPARLLSVLQSSEKYLNLLRSLSEHVAVLRKDKDLWKKMKTAPFLLAFKEISPAKGDAADIDEDDTPVRHYQLASPEQIVILDDYISYRLFKDGLLCAPEEDGLEDLYAALGSQNLGNLVTDELKIGLRSSHQEGAVWLRKHVVERSKIFIHEYSKHARDPIKHDAKWLEKNLAVQVVGTLGLRRTLRGRNQHTEKKSAAAAITNQGLVLYVASDRPKPDMYQVGYAICQHILHRPSQQAYTFFEPFLKLDLLDLRSRGYNVDRILRVKAAEARMAEEERRKALEAEQARMREQAQFQQQEHAQTAQAEPATPRERSRAPVMPGSFDSPESPAAPAHAIQQQQQQDAGANWGRNLFSNLTKRLGLDELVDNDDERQKSRGGLDENDGRSSTEQNTQNTKGTLMQEGGASNVKDNLHRAIDSTRAYGSSSLFSPPKTQDVKEQATYCDSTSKKDLYRAADASNGMPVFMMKNLQVDVEQFLAQNHKNINAFAVLIRQVGEVYGIKSKALHMFYDDSNNTIAFNSVGSIFCNLRYFNQLHASTMDDGEKRAEAATWWWVVVAHELAHNIEQLHNAQHSFYTESFIQQYFPKMMAKARELQASAPARALPAAAAPPSRQPPPYSEY
ncbi:hypothetical protein JX265_004145 [Neoarthrinium moseri]|uniref:Sacsin/Nov domain-containing protein n=1 Tax=Neoarthrinium moseri TaxID=1658444 RepID=A0A9P9WRW0_9PEZI|nr:hypothetical protein JX265_004145 [Neoarthrinium moseri]